MKGFFSYLSFTLLSALLVLAASGAAVNFSDDIAAEAEVRAFQSVDNASLAAYAGQDALQSGRYEEAVEHFSWAVEADPSWMAAWYLKAYSLARLNRSAEALAAVDQALLLDPGDRDSNNLRADILESLGRGEEAVRYRSAAAAGDPLPQTTGPVTSAPTTKAPLNPLVSISSLLVAACLLGMRPGSR